MARTVSITVTPKQGVLTFFIVRLDEKSIIYNYATSEYTATEEISDAPVVLRVETFGVRGAQYAVKIDLPGEENDSTHNRTLPSHVDNFRQDI